MPTTNLVTDGTTFINATGLCFTLLMSGLMVVLPRKWALVPVVVLTCYMTMGQRVLIAGLDFTMLRILTLFGWARLILRSELQPIALNRVDKAIICWIISSTVVYTLLWQTGDAFINRLGLAYNAIGMYFLFRFLIRNDSDVARIFKLLALLMIPLATAMLVEKMTGRNAFAIFGGVSDITLVRDGALRCQGPFGHPILAGTFGAAAFPLFAGLWARGSKLVAFLGMLSATIITITSASSGPVMGYAAGVVGLCAFALRKHMRALRWGLLLMLIGLHVVMKAPVWFLMARVSVFSGSTGYHRAILIDHALSNFGEWWLLGTKSTVHWGYFMYDVTNQYILEGVTGGLLTMLLFILIIARCFGTVGKAIRRTQHLSLREQFLYWALGAALLTHVVSFLSVTYFDQNIVMWYSLLAMISAIAAPSLAVEHRPRISDLARPWWRPASATPSSV